MSAKRPFAVYLWMVVFSVGCGCSDGGRSNVTDADASIDSSSLTEASIPDSGIEASVPDAGPGSDCTISTLPAEEISPGLLYRLPPSGRNFDGDFDGQKLIISECRCPCSDPRRVDIYMFDLDTMEETAIVERLASQYGGRSLVDGRMVYEDYSYNHPDVPGYEYRTELILHDTTDGQETLLTDGNWSKYRVKYNGTHVAYWSTQWNPSDLDCLPDLVLRDLETEQEILLADHDQNIQLHDMQGDHVAWLSVPVGEPGIWEVFHHRISSGTTQRLHIDSPYLFAVGLSGTHILWNDIATDDYEVFAHDLALGTTQQVTSVDYDQVFINGKDHLVNVFDYRHSGGGVPGVIYDLYLHDLEKKTSRRLTATSAPWGIFRPSCRWLIYTEQYSDDSMHHFAWDAKAAGVLDDDCHVIPCDPQTEQCEVIEWRGP